MNRTKLSICQSCLSSDEIENILTMFNHDWSVDLRSNCNRIVHFCRAGCCSSDDECHQKCRVALYAAAYRLWDIPLLYRWKHFEPAAEYVLRCLLLHGVLVSAWAHVCEPGDKEVNLQAVDEDNPDISPAMRQAVRVNKVLAMLTSPDAIENFAKALLYTLPLSQFMDELSFVESCRLRLRLRSQGLELPKSRCQVSTEDFVLMNMKLVTGPV
ncbi:HMG box domain-containing protein [Durusdinium trenchii]|uniref:HMG box domain-containing protein n=1 Tax=Durusdinium trenchii TaxID=1381693 RepID=A0ABP0SDT2_9DINO